MDFSAITIDTINMKTIIWDDYIFNIEIENTKNIYINKPLIFSGLVGYLPKLTSFLTLLGIDIGKPFEFALNDPSDLIYHAFGTFSSKTGHELDFYGEGKFVSAVISSHGGILNIEVFGIKL